MLGRRLPGRLRPPTRPDATRHPCRPYVLLRRHARRPTHEPFLQGYRSDGCGAAEDVQCVPLVLLWRGVDYWCDNSEHAIDDYRAGAAACALLVYTGARMSR